MAAALTIQLKTLKNEKFNLDVTESMTVKGVKELCDTKLKLGTPDTQRLIHAGKILKDESTVGECKIKNNDIVVIMTSKKPAAPAPATPAKAETPAATPAATDAAKPAAGGAGGAAAPATPAKPTDKPADAKPATGGAASPAAKDDGKKAGAGTGAAASAAASSLVTGQDYNAMVANLMGLGFNHDQVVKALQAAFNNPDRAVEYLFNPQAMEAALRAGGGAGAGGQARPQGGAQGGQGGAQAGGAQAGAGQGAGQGQGAGAGAGQGGAQGQAMAAELNQLRAIMQQQPQFIPMLLQQIAQSDPQLAQAVQQNPEAFVRLLQNPQLAGQLLAAAAQGGGGQGGQGGQGQGAANQPRAITVQLTAEEKKSVDNLVRLGFSQSKAVEAFILCDRKEDLAANYLFENRGEDADGGDY